MKKYSGIYMVLLAVSLLVVQGCAYNEMTYFRKNGASVQDERKDWGLCGGNFLLDGQVQPVVDTQILQCMSEKGYQSLNDYYEEQQISFMNRSGAIIFRLSSVSNQTLEECGFKRLKKGLCDYMAYIPKKQLSRVIKCMSTLGYEATLPRYKSAFMIIEDDRSLSPNFCLFLSPKNRKGGLSLGGYRME